jgi:hypothetical protein
MITLRVTSIDTINRGTIGFDTDAGIVTWTDLPISATPAAGVIESYTASIDGNDVLTIYGEANGSGAAQNMRVGIGLQHLGGHYQSTAPPPLPALQMAPVHILSVWARTQMPLHLYDCL